MRYYDKGPRIGRFRIWGITEDDKCFLRISTVIKNKEYIGCIKGDNITDALINLFSCKKSIVSAKSYLDLG